MHAAYIYILDSLRYDYVGGDLTPNFNRLAGDGIFFTNAVSQATWSNPAAMALLTGRYPTAVGKFGHLPQSIKPKKVALPTTVDTLATLFANAGFATAAYSTNEYFSSAYRMDRGFARMPSIYDLPEYADRANLSRRVAQKFKRDRELLLPLITSKDLLNIMWADYEAQPTVEKRLNVVWTMDTHAPFYDRNLVSNLEHKEIEIVSRLTDDVERAKVIYQDMVAFADHAFGTFIDRLKAEGHYDNSFIIVLSDHGESFGENYQLAHGGLPFEEQLHIPLILKLPGNEFVVQRNNALVGLIDILPTLADWYDLPLKRPVDGHSMLPAIHGKTGGHDFLMVNDQTQDNMWYYGALRGKDTKVIFRSVNRDRINDLPPPPTRTLPLAGKLRQYIQHPTYFARDFFPGLLYRKESWVFDLAKDPTERRNLLWSFGGLKMWVKGLRRFANLRKAALEFFTMNVRSVQLAHTNEAVEQRLRDLGYLD
jgi:arylsulfatase A-like enzyme